MALNLRACVGAAPIATPKLFPFGNCSGEGSGILNAYDECSHLRTASKADCGILLTTMNEEPIQSKGADAPEPAERQLAIDEAAQLLGMDSFTMLSFIQRGKVNPTRSPSGEIMVAESELTELTEKGR